MSIDVLYQNIKKRREELGISQEELATALGYKHRSSINKIELGINDLPQSKIKEFAVALNTTVSTLMGWDKIEKKTDAIDSLKILLKDIYDDVIIKDDYITGSYEVILSKDNIKITLEEIPFETLFNTICEIIPECVDVIIKNASNGDYESIPNITCLYDDEVLMLESYRNLKQNDKYKVKERIDVLLEQGKYHKPPIVHKIQREQENGTVIKKCARSSDHHEPEEETLSEEKVKLLKSLKSKTNLNDSQE